MFSLRSKILTIALILLTFLSGTFFIYSRITTSYYTQLRLENIELIMAYEKAKLDRIFILQNFNLPLEAVPLEVIYELNVLRPTENSFAVLLDPISGRTIFGNSDTVIVSDYRVFERLAANGLLLRVYVPEEELFEEIEVWNFYYTLAVAVSSILMIFLAFFLVSGLTYVPIKKITSRVEEIAKGNLDINIEIYSKDELGSLALAINKMASDLKTMIHAYAEEHAEKERIGAELNVASEIQSSMLPGLSNLFHSRTDFEVFASMIPAREVGGDFYDYFIIDKDNIALVIADVSGKGVPAALFMVITKILIKSNAMAGKSPGEVFEAVNNILCVNNESVMFVTALLIYYNIKTGSLIYSNAGHNPPMLKRGNGNYEYMKIKANVVLGFLEDTVYEDEKFAMEGGDSLFLYTDGVTESLNAQREFFTESGLYSAINKYRHCVPEALLSSIRTELDIFSDYTEQADDITMLALQVKTINNNLPEINNPPLKQLTIEADMGKLSEAVNFIGRELKQNNCPEETKNEIYLAVEEIFVNIAKYAYAPGTGNVTITVNAGDELEISFEDTGIPYNPLEEKEPSLNIPPEDRDLGGLGIFLFKKIMDEVSYTREGNKNILRAIKNLQKSSH